MVPKIRSWRKPWGLGTSHTESCKMCFMHDLFYTHGQEGPGEPSKGLPSHYPLLSLFLNTLVIITVLGLGKLRSGEALEPSKCVCVLNS